MAERRRALPAAERVRLSAVAATRLVALPELRAARTIAGFVAKSAEIDPAEALRDAGRAGTTVVLPRVSPQVPRLRFHRVPQGGSLRPGAFGIAEPDPAWPEVAIEEIDLYVVPGLAFDAQGGRVGYGGGYYDEVTRHVRSGGRGLLVGFGYDFQVVPQCPVGHGDEAMDAVVTDARVLRCPRGAR